MNLEKYGKMNGKDSCYMEYTDFIKFIKKEFGEEECHWVTQTGDNEIILQR